MTDVDALVEQATESFDLMEYVSERTTAPTDSVAVYLDYETAYEMDRLRKEWDLGEKGPRGIADEDENTLVERLKELQEKVKGNTLTIHMRAVNGPERGVIGKRVQKDIKVNKNMSDEEKQEAALKREDRVLVEWLAAAITKIVRPDGAAVTDVGVGEVDFLQSTLYDAEWDKLVVLFNNLSFARELADRVVDAGFPSGETVLG